MDKLFRNLLVNSTLAFVAAFIITTFIHECAHFLSYLLFGAKPTLLHNYVQTAVQQIPAHVKIISALAGPVVSLVQGIVFGMVVSMKRKNTARHLFFLWLSLLGFVNFCGYLVMTPLSTVGDTGKVAELLRIDFFFRVIIAVMGFALLIFVVLRVGKNFSNFIPAGQDEKKRTSYVYRVMFFPIIIGSVVNTVLAFPAVAFLSIIYPATSPYVIMMSFPVILKSPSPHSNKSELEDNIKKSLLLLALFAIILNRLLTLGVG